MNEITAQNADSQEFIPLLRELLGAYHAFASFDANGHRLSGSDLTVAQANVIFALGNTYGMTCKDIGDWTHITKGTLTGVIDRLENKGLVERWAVEGDGRRHHGICVGSPNGKSSMENTAHGKERFCEGRYRRSPDQGCQGCIHVALEIRSQNRKERSGVL